MARLHGKTAVISGGANGLGKAIAQRMSEAGAAIQLFDLDAGGEAVAADLQRAGGKAAFTQCDVTDESAVKQAINAAAQRFGSIDILVNNAGTEGPNKSTEHYELADWNRVMAVNTTGVFVCTKHAVPHIRAAGGGSIINMVSIYGLVGGADVSAYHASKGAVKVMTKNDALSFAPDRIRVNSICPGFIETSMFHRFAEDTGITVEAAREMVNSLHPLGGMGEPDDVAWASVYLAADESKWVTGSELVVDGGYTAQ